MKASMFIAIVCVALVVIIVALLQPVPECAKRMVAQGISGICMGD